MSFLKVRLLHANTHGQDLLVVHGMALGPDIRLDLSLLVDNMSCASRWSCNGRGGESADGDNGETHLDNSFLETCTHKEQDIHKTETADSSN